MSRPIDRPRKGIRFGKYLLLRPLGTGGMSQVWLAIRDIGASEKNCTIKMTLDLVGLDAFRREGIITEVRVGARLRNSHIVQIVDAGELGKVAYIELEYVDGVDLSQLLKEMRTQRAAVPLPLAVYIVRGVLEALYFAHERHQIGGVPEVVIHRDLTPDNIIISSAGEVKVMDFGIGKLAADQPTGAFVKGKMRYMPPEQTRGKTYVQTDLFYVGALLYELIEGVRFRHDIAPADMDVAAARGEIPSLTRTDVPTELSRLYSALVAKEPGDRVRSASLAIKLLKQWPGLPADADDMRTAYERYARAQAHSGYTHADFEFPTELEHLMRAVLEAGPVVPARAAPAVGEPDAPRERHDQRLGTAHMGTTADAPMPAQLEVLQRPALPVAADVGPSAPGRTVRFGASSDHTPERTEPWRGGRPTPSSDASPSVATDRLAPVFSGGPSPRGGSDDDALDAPGSPLPRWGGSTEPAPSSEGTAPSSVSQASSRDGTAFVVVRSKPPWMLVGMLAVVALVAAVVTASMLSKEARPQATTAQPASARSIDVADAAPAADDATTPELGPVAVPATRDAVQPAADVERPEPTPTLEPTSRTELGAATQPMPGAETVPQMEPTPRASSSSEPAHRERKTKRAPKPEVEVRFTPMAAKGELRLGKKKVISVQRTLDTVIPVGTYRLAWRLDGATAWTPAASLVLEENRLYLVRLGPSGPQVSSQAAKP